MHVNTKLRIIFLCIIFATAALSAQQRDGEGLRKRLEKLELIMRLQDMRTVHDGKLIAFLSDFDPVVRERATLAFGSLQDTSALPNLLRNVQDRSANVQVAAAFAIGQTGVMLSRKGRESLQHELIWKKLGWTLVDEILIEEIGKFGDETALNDLIVRYGSTFPRVFPKAVTMSIARFAIRGITSVDAVRYLITLVRTPDDDLRWRVMYALMRVGDHPEIRYELERLARMHTDESPTVRMNVATLLGKLKDAMTSLEPLQKLAQFDRDWRVRVNALKALGNFDVNEHTDVVSLFIRNFFDGDDHVSLTALSSIGNSNFKRESNPKIGEELWRALLHITINERGGYRIPTQGEAAVALAKLYGVDALPYVQREGLTSPRLQAKFLEAAAATGSVDASAYLIRYLKKVEPLEYRAALEGLAALGRKNHTDSTLLNLIFRSAIDALETRDVAIVTTAAAILADSLFRRPDAVDALMRALTTARVPEDVESMQALIGALGQLKDPRALPLLRRQLEQPDRTVSLAAASVLQAITGEDYSSSVRTHTRPLFADPDFTFLRSLQDTMLVRVETIRGDITLEVYKNAAPFTIVSFLKLARRGFYKGIVFHRVVPNFVIQAGDPRGDGWGGPGYAIRSEFSPFTYDTGALGMASAGKDTEGSQFFITHSPQPHLDGRYTLFGKVVVGMDVVNRIQIGDRILDIKLLGEQ